MFVFLCGVIVKLDDKDSTLMRSVQFEFVEEKSRIGPLKYETILKYKIYPRQTLITELS